MGTSAVPLTTATLAGYCARLSKLRDLASSPDALVARCSLIRIEDDAMAGAGMSRGAHVIVMTEQEFSSNDIVLAHTPHGDLIRRFVTQDRPPYISVRPDPEDALYRTIPLGPDSELRGRVIGAVQQNGTFIEVRNEKR